jgi:hypothetical protein
MALTHGLAATQGRAEMIPSCISYVITINPCTKNENWRQKEKQNYSFCFEMRAREREATKVMKKFQSFLF